MRQLTERNPSASACSAWIAALAPAVGSVRVTADGAAAEPSGIIDADDRHPGWHRSSGQLGHHADTQACGD